MSIKNYISCIVATQAIVKMNNKIHTAILLIIKWGSCTSIISVIIALIYFTLEITIPKPYEFVVGILGLAIFLIPFITFFPIRVIGKYDLGSRNRFKDILLLFLINILFVMGYMYWGLLIEGEN